MVVGRGRGKGCNGQGRHRRGGEESIFTSKGLYGQRNLGQMRGGGKSVIVVFVHLWPIYAPKRTVWWREKWEREEKTEKTQIMGREHNPWNNICRRGLD